MTVSQKDTLYRARERVADASDEAELLRVTVECLQNLFVADACACWRGEQQGDHRTVETELELEDRVAGSEVSQEIASRAYVSGEPVLVRDRTEDDRFEVKSEYRSILSIPIPGYGVVQLAARDPRTYDQQAMAVGDLFCSYVGQRFEDVRVTKPELPKADIADRFLEVADVMMVALDATGKIVFTNAEARTILGYEEGALIGADWFETCIPERMRMEVRDIYDQLMSGEIEPADRYENRIVTADGEERIVEWHNTILRDDEGRVIGTLSSGLDVTERKEQRREKEFLWQAIEKANSSLTLADPSQDDLPIVYANETFEQLTGYSEREISGQNCRILQGQNTRDEAVAELREGIDNEEPVTVELRNYRKDGTEFWNKLSVTPVYDEDGSLVRYLGTQEDITERKEREAELERYELYLESVSDLVTVVNENGIIQYDSPGVSEMLGYEPDERVGDSGFKHIHPEDRDRVEAQFERRISPASTARPVEYRVRTKDGAWIWAESHARVLTDNPLFEGVVITTREITERKQQEQKRQQVIDRVTDGIFELDADWQISFINGQGEQMLNASEAELLGRNVWDVFDEARGTKIERRSREVMDTREATSFVAYYPELDSWFDLQEYPNDDGGISVYFRDITERKEREQARERAEKQYQTLLEMAPDPIVAADTETEEILEANEAAADLFECPKGELIGRAGSSLYPTEDREAYTTFITEAEEVEGTRRRLPDGSPVYIVTGEGDRIPVEISAQTLELDDRSVVFKIFRDISEQLQYERRLRSLNEVTRELFDVETEREVERKVVETLGDLLNVSTVSFYHFDEEDWELQPVTRTTAGESGESLDDLPVLEPGVGVEWQALSSGETAIVEDFQARETEYDLERTVRSELVVPVADRGLLVVGDTRPGMFTDRTVSLVETLAATAEAALSRTRWERELQGQRQELQQVESINEQIRGIGHAVVQAETRAELEQMVCERLVKSDPVDFAWIGRVDFQEQRLSPEARAGDCEGYLGDLSLSLEGESQAEPSVQAARSRGVCSSSNTAREIHRNEWRSAAVERGFQSILSIPLVYQETLYGVLSVYASTRSGFSEKLRSVLEELGDLLAHSAVAIERKEALETDQTMELDFAIQDPNSLFCRLTAGAEFAIELDGFVPQSDQSTLVFARITRGPPDRALEAARGLDEIEQCRLIETGEDTVLQCNHSGSFIRSVLSDQGLLLRRLSADDTQCRMTVEVPRTVDARQAVNTVTSQYEDAQLLAKREGSTSPASVDSVLGSVLDRLTTRQREVIETAYRCGYFDSPRRASGEDIASMFQFSNSAFHQHLREAENNLFEALIEQSGISLATTDGPEKD